MNYEFEQNTADVFKFYGFVSYLDTTENPSVFSFDFVLSKDRVNFHERNHDLIAA